MFFRLFGFIGFCCLSGIVADCAGALFAPSQEEYRKIRCVHEICGVIDLERNILSNGEDYEATDDERANLIGAYLCSIKLLTALGCPSSDDAWSVWALRSECVDDSLIDKAEQNAVRSLRDRVANRGVKYSQQIVEAVERIFPEP